MHLDFEAFEVWGQRRRSKTLHFVFDYRFVHPDIIWLCLWVATMVVYSAAEIISLRYSGETIAVHPRTAASCAPARLPRCLGIPLEIYGDIDERVGAHLLQLLRFGGSENGGCQAPTWMQGRYKQAMSKESQFGNWLVHMFSAFT